MRVFPPIRLLALSLLYAFSLLLISCSNGDLQSQSVGETNNAKSGVAMPQALQRADLPSSGTLSAVLTVDPDAGGQPQSMNISGDVASFTGTIPTGDRDLKLDIIYESQSVGTLTLVTARKTVTVSSGSTINFTEKDYEYIDSDGDEATNIRELEIGSNPNGSGSTPLDFDDNYEDNDSLDTAYDLSALENVFLHTPSEPGNLTGGNLGQGYLIATDSVTDGIDYFTFTPPAGKDTLNLQIEVTLSTWVRFFYFDSAGNTNHFDRAIRIDNGNEDIIEEILTFDNPPDRTFFIQILTDEDGDLSDLGDFVNGGYHLKWWTE